MRIASVTIFALLGACGPQGPKAYPPQYEVNFMRACEAQRPAEGVCPCTWEKIEREIAADEFAAFELLPPDERRMHPLYGQVQQFAVECRDRDETPVQNPPAP